MPLGVALLQATQQKRAQQAQAAATQAAEEAERRRNPFANMWRDMQQGAKAGGSSSKGSSGAGRQTRGGPIVEAEYTVLRDDDDAGSKGKAGK